jgi:integrase/recombinase XerC
VRQVDLAGGTHLELVSGVVHLHPQDVMVEAVLRGYRTQTAHPTTDLGIREITTTH